MASDVALWSIVCVPTLYTIHPTPYTPHPTPHTLHSTPYTLHPAPYTLHPTPYTRFPPPLSRSLSLGQGYTATFSMPRGGIGRYLGDAEGLQRATKWLPEWLGCEPRLIVVSLNSWS